MERITKFVNTNGDIKKQHNNYSKHSKALKNEERNSRVSKINNSQHDYRDFNNTSARTLKVSTSNGIQLYMNHNTNRYDRYFTVWANKKGYLVINHHSIPFRATIGIACGDM